MKPRYLQNRYFLKVLQLLNFGNNLYNNKMNSTNDISSKGDEEQKDGNAAAKLQVQILEGNFLI